MENKFNFIRTFENFVANQPERSPDTKPAPARPTTEPGKDPGQRPERRSPIRRHKPAVDPKPKAEVEDVISLVNISASDEQKKRLNDYYAKRDK
tara:strand:- start:1343 stop:1624 length:282 start_codon:yes stop_codon:yes gene_type:complete